MEKLISKNNYFILIKMIKELGILNTEVVAVFHTTDGQVDIWKWEVPHIQTFCGADLAKYEYWISFYDNYYENENGDYDKPHYQYITKRWNENGDDYWGFLNNGNGDEIRVKFYNDE